MTVSSNLTADGTAGGTLSAPGTIDLRDSGVTANTYTKVTVNAKGVVTSATNITGADITSGTIGGSTAINSSGKITTTGTVTGATLSGTNVTARNVQYFDADTNKITVQAPALAADYSLTLPAADGSSGQALVTNGSGALSWASAGGGSATSVSATNGSAAAPSIAFSNDTDTGFYSSGTNTVGVAAGGTNIFNISSLGVESTITGGGVMTQANGTAAAPTFSFSGDTDTGWYRPAANTMAAATGGSERIRIDSSGNVGIGTTSPTTLFTVGTGVNPVIVSGTLSPDVTGTYAHAGTYAGKNYYSRGVSYYVFWDTTYSQWAISGSLGNIAGQVWASLGGGATPNTGNYIPYNGASGTATLTIGTATNLTVDSAGNLTSGGSGAFQTLNVTGNVGVGTTSPSAKLQVAGPIVSSPSTIASGASVDLSLSSTFTMASVGGSTITLSNMVDGGTYLLLITDTTSRTYTFSGCANSYFKPANTATTASTRTMYSIVTAYNGATYDCWINWASGYQ